jgi:hypothetical protein
MLVEPSVRATGRRRRVNAAGLFVEAEATDNACE